MNISKSLFKNYTRCANFAPLYDMYLFRNLHHVKSVDGVDVGHQLELVGEIPEGIFDEEKEEIIEIFSNMFDEKTGEDLTEITNAQLEAYRETFVKVEQLAGKYVTSKYPGNHIFDVDTKKQKKFSFSKNGNTYYCYLDIYSECFDDTIKVFEVKSTTSSKFYELGKKIVKESPDHYRIPTSERYESIFVRGGDDVLRLREVYGDVETDKLNYKEYNNYRQKMLNRFGSDGTGKYVFDLAVQRYIIENSLRENSQSDLIDKMEYYLVVLNGDYCFDGTNENDEPVYDLDPDGNPLFMIIDLSIVTKEWQETIDIMRQKIEADMKAMAISNKRFGIHCEHKKTTQCKFHPVCFHKFLQDGSILEYMRKHFAFKDEFGDRVDVFTLMNQGRLKINDIPRNYLDKHYNLVQYDCYVNNSVFADKDVMHLALKTLRYPLYHLDFESYGSPLPRYQGEYPYTQSLFQFSLHIEREKFSCDKHTDHIEYLAPDHLDRRRELAEKLIEAIDLSKGGTVIVYNENFEKLRLKELAILFPDLSEKLWNIRNHIFDLFFVLKGNQKMFTPLLEGKFGKDRPKQINYYHNNMHGSFSIKKILPLFTDLSYSDLEVKNGTEAMLVYSQLPYLTEKEYQEKYLALREYCKQDTWAMVEILWGLWRMK
ncbi:MAG: DUF2779 domain-containing protein [Bacilli bacterium]|jgi:hypothetical protein|nr:DUF2779 domain-containing protein [Acholeplasmataceae bacterium]